MIEFPRRGKELPKTTKPAAHDTAVSAPTAVPVEPASIKPVVAEAGAQTKAQQQLLDNACSTSPVTQVPVEERAGQTTALHALRSAKQTDVFAAIDLGSSSAKMLVLQRTSSGWKTLVDQKIGCALGKGVENGESIPVANQQRALDALKALVAVAAEHGVEVKHIPMITTAVVRNASNGDAFVNRVQAELGLAPRVLNGDEEADIGYRGALGTLLHTPGRYASLDLGGGSFQLAVGTHEGLTDGGSTQLGSNIIIDTMINPRADALGHVDDALFKHIDAELDRLAPMPLDAALLADRTLLATGGVSKFLRVQLGKDIVTRSEIDGLRRQLGALSVVERSAFVQLNKSDEQKAALGIGNQAGAVDYGKKLPGSLSLLLHILDDIGVSDVQVSSTDSRHALIFRASSGQPFARPAGENA